MLAVAHDYLVLLHTGQRRHDLMHPRMLTKSNCSSNCLLFEQQVEDVGESAYVQPRTDSLTHTWLASYHDYLLTDHD